MSTTRGIEYTGPNLPQGSTMAKEEADLASGRLKLAFGKWQIQDNARRFGNDFLLTNACDI